MGLMGDSRASVRDSALILASVADPSKKLQFFLVERRRRCQIAMNQKECEVV